MDFRSMYVVMKDENFSTKRSPVAVCYWYDAALRMAKLVNGCTDEMAHDFIVEVPIVRFEEAADGE